MKNPFSFWQKEDRVSFAACTSEGNGTRGTATERLEAFPGGSGAQVVMAVTAGEDSVCVGATLVGKSAAGAGKEERRETLAAPA